MNIYKYQGIDIQGQLCRGWLLAKNELRARVNLEKRSILVREIDPVKSLAFFVKPKRPEFSRASLLLFTQSLAALLDSGTPLLNALNVLENQAVLMKEKSLIGALISFIRKGRRFSDALELFPRTFDRCYVECVRAAEVAGSLASVLRQLVDYLESQASLRRRVKRACVYPAAVMIVALVVVVLLLVGVVPRFERLFEELFQGASLPYMTQCVMGMSRFLGDYGGVCLGLGALGGGVLFWLTQKRMLSFAGMIGWVPWVGRMQERADLARWTRIQSALMGAGVPLLRALETSQKVVFSARLQKQLHGVYQRVRDGERFGGSFEREEILPPLLLSLVKTGEQTGELASQLLLISGAMEDDLKEMLSVLTTLLEPALIVVVSLIVGGLVVSVFLPMMGVLEQLTAY